jgi:hypothetical protein
VYIDGSDQSDWGFHNYIVIFSISPASPLVVVFGIDLSVTDRYLVMLVACGVTRLAW